MRRVGAVLMGALAGTSLGLAIALAAPAGTTLEIIGDTPQSMVVAENIARAIDHEGGLRILAVAGKGPVQSLTDLATLEGIDATITSSDALAYMNQNGLAEGIAGKYAFVLRLAGLDVYVIARDGITRLSDLAGKTVVTGPTASASFVAGQFLLGDLATPVKPLIGDGQAALRAIAEGRADAAILVGRRPLPVLQSAELVKGLHLIDVPAVEALQAAYSPALISNEDYPGLVAADRPVETLATSLVIAVRDSSPGSPAYERTRKFTDTLFAAIQPDPGTDAGLNLAATVPGWTRHGAATAALADIAAKSKAAAPAAEN
ncbi:MAG: hypothetical protein HY245_12540 [Rhizobiales bacterium]|nr:hypothetical protein [Hyphomicrobiales bacterium]MBI3674218.1 hypothetical protein [Hyphomicrobiales bacterium]